MDIGGLTGQISIDDQLSSGLNIATQQVQKFADSFEGALGGVAIGIGAGVAAIGAMVGAISALGNRGADVNDVADSLEHFAGSAENADAILHSLQKGTLGTVDDFMLMKNATHLLSAGVNLNAKDFETLGSAAFVLQNRGLGGTKEMMDLVSDAMVTGRTRALSMALGVIDVKDAEGDYAHSLGISKDELSETGKVEAKRMAIMGMLNAAVKDAGAQHRDFGEQLEYVVAQGKNFLDSLSQQVAKSPVLAAALEGIGEAFQVAFGGTSKSNIDAIVVGINKAAIIIVDFGIGTVEAARVVNVAFSLVKSVVLGVETGLIVMAAAATSAYAAIAKGATYLPGASDGTRRMAIEAKNAADNMWALSKGMDAQVQEAARGIVGNSAFDKTLDAVGGTLLNVRDKMIVASKATTESSKTVDEHGKAHVRVQGNMVDTSKAADEAAKKSAAAWKEYSSVAGSIYDQLSSDTVEGIKWDLKRGISQSTLATVYRATAEQVAAIDTLLKEEIATSKLAAESANKLAEAEAKHGQELRKLANDRGVALMKIEATNYADRLASQRGYDDEIARRTLSSYDFQKRAVMQHLADQKLALETKGGDWKASFDLDTRAANSAIDAIEWDKIQRDIDETDQYTQEWAKRSEQALADLANAFAQLGQIAGGSLGDMMKGAGNIVVGLSAAQKANEKWGGSAGIASALFSSQASATDKAAAGVASAAAIVNGAQNVWSATESHASAAGNALSGAMAGAQAGAMFGPWGMAIGAAAGLIVGIVRGKPQWAKASEEVGRDFGVKISGELAKEIAKNAKELFHGDRMAAEYDALAKIVQQAGGLTDKNLSQLEGRLRDVFVLNGRGQLDIAQTAKILDENWQTFTKAATSNVGVLDAKMVEMIALNDQFGTQSKAIAEYLGQQGAAGATAFADALGVTSSAYKTLDTDQTQLKTLTEQLTTATGDQQKSLQAQIATVTADIATQRGIIDATGVASQGAATAMAAGIVGSFDGMIAGGASFNDAIKAIAPAVTNLDSILQQTGFEGGAAFDLIKGQIALAKDAIAGPALTSVNSLSLGMVALSNMGKLNQETFTGLGGQISQTFNSLVKQGKDGGDVMVAMQPSLQRLWEEQKQFHYTLDDSTQALLDEAEASGLVGEKHKSTTQQMLDATLRITTAVEGLAVVFGVKLPASAESAAAGVNTALDKIKTPKVDAPWKDWGDAPKIEGAATGGVVGMATGGVVYASAGTLVQGPWQPMGTDTVPAMLTPGEGVVTVFGMSRLGPEGLNAINSGQSQTNDDVRQEIRALRDDFTMRLPNLLTAAMKNARAA
jgi:hypothetical protein